MLNRRKLRLGKRGASALFIGSAASLLILTGCAGTPKRIHAANRYKHGIVYVLPGIEGKSAWNRDVAVGLDEGGVTSAIEIYDWTTGLPGGFVFNLASIDRNRQQAKALAERIVAHREKYPGTPVHLVGHSGGGGIAILTLEALPAGRQIDMAILLAPALSPDYDLSTALRRTRYGVCNFYSEKDVSFLTFGTSLFGAIDRDYGASAGAVGFTVPTNKLNQADRRLYSERLKQVEWNPGLKRYGASGSHVGWASKQFAAEYLAPIIKGHEAMRSLSAASQ